MKRVAEEFGCVAAQAVASLFLEVREVSTRYAVAGVKALHRFDCALPFDADIAAYITDGCKYSRNSGGCDTQL
jgi:hypothetical protein